MTDAPGRFSGRGFHAAVSVATAITLAGCGAPSTVPTVAPAHSGSVPTLSPPPLFHAAGPSTVTLIPDKEAPSTTALQPVTSPVVAAVTSVFCNIPGRHGPEIQAVLGDGGVVIFIRGTSVGVLDEGSYESLPRPEPYASGAGVTSFGASRGATFDAPHLTPVADSATTSDPPGFGLRGAVVCPLSGRGSVNVRLDGTTPEGHVHGTLDEAVITRCDGAYTDLRGSVLVEQARRPIGVKILYTPDANGGYTNNALVTLAIEAPGKSPGVIGHDFNGGTNISKDARGEMVDTQVDAEADEVGVDTASPSSQGRGGSIHISGSIHC